MSTSRQAEEGLSLEDQEIKCKQFFEMHMKDKGLRWGGMFIDPGISGKTDFTERPAGKLLHDRLRPGDNVIMCRLDRGFRNFRNCVEVTEGWLDRGIHFHLLDIQLSTDTIVGRMVHRILAAFAQMLREMIVENIKAGFARKKDLYGMAGHKMPMGYKNAGSAKKPKKVPFDEERRQMALIVHLYEDWHISLIEIERLFSYYDFEFSPGGSVWSWLRIKTALNAYITEGMTDPCCEFPPAPDSVRYKRKMKSKHPQMTLRKPQFADQVQTNPKKRWVPAPADSSLAIRVKDSTIPSRVMRLQSIPVESFSAPRLPGPRRSGRRCELASRSETSSPASPGSPPERTPTPASEQLAQAMECAALVPPDLISECTTSLSPPNSPTSS